MAPFSFEAPSQGEDELRHAFLLAPSCHPGRCDPGTGRAPNICAARADSAISSYKRRHRTIQRVGDGAKQFGFSDLQNAVAGDRMRAGLEHERPKLRRRLSEVIQGAVDLRKIAFVTTT